MKTRPLELVGYVVNGASIPLQFYLTSALDASVALPGLQYFGFLVLAIGALLVVLSIIGLARNRHAGLVQHGVFGLVRHPMYVGAMLLFSAFAFFCPHWLVLVVSAVNIGVVYCFILQGERLNVVKFGNAYKEYMQSVPRANLLAGVVRRLRRGAPQV